MGYNQLFRKIPDKILLDKLLEAFNLKSIDDVKLFSKLDLLNHDSVNKMNDLKVILQEYYLPCKARAYLNELTTKNIITILRQCLRIFGYKINSKEKYIKGVKYLLYHIFPIDASIQRDINCKDNKCVVIFQ